jgi:hypothetical protein
MNEHLTLVTTIDLAIALALFACYLLAKWVGRQRTLRAAEQIARFFETEQALARASPGLRDKLERYRLASSCERGPELAARGRDGARS